MVDRSRFAQCIASLDLSHTDRAVALLWYYRHTQEFDETTASELPNDLRDEGFPKPNVTRLKRDLARSRYTITGRQSGSLQIDVRRLSDLAEKYGQFLRAKKVDVRDWVIPNDLVTATRVCRQAIVFQITGTYDNAFSDACATMMRGLRESLIIEVYIHAGRVGEIRHNGVFLGIERLITFLRAARNLTLARNTPKAILDVKALRDTAARDRVYATSKQDIDDDVPRYRRMLQDLLVACGITMERKTSDSTMQRTALRAADAERWKTIG